mmetsp:Transcript_16058/g.50047  ORF Transcript_16058/g.50047 Transcript_16058/m.50047 type:complete len:486 (-) Transcript_16058:74-1531(-)
MPAPGSAKEPRPWPRCATVAERSERPGRTLEDARVGDDGEWVALRQVIVRADALLRREAQVEERAEEDAVHVHVGAVVRTARLRAVAACAQAGDVREVVVAKRPALRRDQLDDRRAHTRKEQPRESSAVHADQHVSGAHGLDLSAQRQVSELDRADAHAVPLCKYAHDIALIEERAIFLGAPAEQQAGGLGGLAGRRRADAMREERFHDDALGAVVERKAADERRAEPIDKGGACAAHARRRVEVTPDQRQVARGHNERVGTRAPLRCARQRAHRAEERAQHGRREVPFVRRRVGHEHVRLRRIGTGGERREEGAAHRAERVERVGRAITREKDGLTRARHPGVRGACGGGEEPRVLLVHVAGQRDTVRAEVARRADLDNAPPAQRAAARCAPYGAGLQHHHALDGAYRPMLERRKDVGAHAERAPARAELRQKGRTMVARALTRRARGVVLRRASACARAVRPPEREEPQAMRHHAPHIHCSAG